MGERERANRLMAYINYAPMRIGTEDPWALTELAKAGGPGGVWGGTPVGPHLRSQRKSDPRVAACADRGGARNLLYACASRIVLRKLNLLAKLSDGTLSARSFRTLTADNVHHISVVQ